MSSEPVDVEARDLLPCPFCGRDDAVFGYVDDPESPDHGGHFIQCPHLSCGASIGLRYAAGDDPRSLLAQSWNTRADTAEKALAEAREWRPISEAPQDGTDILAWCIHPNARYADTVADKSDWQTPVVARWIEHNGGGWTWHGLCGQFTHWMPLPAPPRTLSSPDEGVGN